MSNITIGQLTLPVINLTIFGVGNYEQTIEFNNFNDGEFVAKSASNPIDVNVIGILGLQTFILSDQKPSSEITQMGDVMNHVYSFNNGVTGHANVPPWTNRISSDPESPGYIALLTNDNNLNMVSTPAYTVTKYLLTYNNGKIIAVTPAPTIRYKFSNGNYADVSSDKTAFISANIDALQAKSVDTTGLTFTAVTPGSIIVDVTGPTGTLGEVQNVVQAGELQVTVNGQLLTAEYVAPDINADICVRAGALVLADQGYVLIEQLDPRKHTIGGGQRIVAVTKTKNVEEKNLVLFRTHALGFNVPACNTYLSLAHKVYGVEAQVWATRNKLSIMLVDYYPDEYLYNVLLETYGVMTVNNMVIETLHPSNPIAKLYL